MSRIIDIVCLAAVIAGVILFLYGANYYNNTIGWTGVVLFLGGILARVVIYVYTRVFRHAEVQTQQGQKP